MKTTADAKRSREGTTATAANASRISQERGLAPFYTKIGKTRPDNELFFDSFEKSGLPFQTFLTYFS